ncbi:MAG: RNA methyltransferase [Verrucomicrobiota bacterium]
MSANSIVIEGRWAVESAVESAFVDVTRLIVEEGRHLDLQERAAAFGIEVQKLNRARMAVEAGYNFHRGVFAEAKRPVGKEPTGPEIASLSHVAVFCGLADPGNLGTAIRSAVAFGAEAIWISKNQGADVYSKKSIRASATGVFQVPVFQIGNLADSLNQFRDSGGVVVGSRLKEATPLPSFQAPARIAVLLGTEASGLPSSLNTVCDEHVVIPISQQMDSLNVGAAAAILFYSLFRPSPSAKSLFANKR